MSTNDRSRTVGFVGLGAMGMPMARNIAEAGVPLVVYDIDPEKGKALEALGATSATSPADLARQAGIVISMVDTVAQNESVFFGKDGVTDEAQSGDVAVIMSTMAPADARAFGDRLEQVGIALLDSPVTGFIAGAEKGELHAYIGGDAAALEKARFALEPMCIEILHVGDTGQGCVLKLVNNMLAQTGRIIVVEAMVLAKAAGLDPETVIKTVTASSGNSVVFQHAAPRLLSRDFSGIRMDITIKDLEMQRQIAKDNNVPLFMANVAQQVYMMAKASGFSSEDPAAVVKVYEQLTGVSMAKED